LNSLYIEFNIVEVIIYWIYYLSRDRKLFLCDSYNLSQVASLNIFSDYYSEGYARRIIIRRNTYIN
jgi:hypothetical protein